MEKTKKEVGPKKAIMKRKKKGGLFHKLEGYLAFDSHMFAPVLSSHTTTTTTTTSSSSLVASPGLFRNDLIGGRKKRFLEKLDDYLISDMHMYAALVSPQPISPHLDASTRVWYTRKVTTEITTQKMAVENRQWLGRNSIQQNDVGKDCNGHFTKPIYTGRNINEAQCVPKWQYSPFLWSRKQDCSSEWEHK